MNWTETPGVDSAGEDDGEAAQPVDEVLYEGDTGSLPLDARRVLCQLLSGPSVDAQRHSQLWPALLREEVGIRARLSDLFLELVLDRDLQVAFTRQADTGELETPILLRSSPLTFIDTVVLLNLRKRLAEAEARGERAAVEEAELVDDLAVFERSQRTDRAGYAKRVATSIEKMKKNSVLQRIRGSDTRYEVAPTLKLLFSAEDVAQLMGVYRGIRVGLDGEKPPAVPEADDAEPGSEGAQS